MREAVSYPVASAIGFGARCGLGLAVASLAACGVTPRMCEVEDPSGNLFVSIPIDLGDGVVASRSSVASLIFGDGIEIVDCASGRSEYIHLSNSVRPNPNLSAEDAAAFRSSFDEVQFSSAEEIFARARAVGATSHTRNLEREDCGCAAFYPELIGALLPANERGRTQ